MNTIEKLWQGFQSLPGQRKMNLVIMAVLIMTGLFSFVYYINQQDYRVLFSNLSSEDASGIVSKLKEKKVPYQLSPSEDVISVPSDQVSELRLELAASGLPHGGGVGFEIFDNRTLGATEFEQQLNYRRALQGELARTINSLDEIKQSRVHIALPKDSLFVDQQKKATASVTIKLKDGRKLSQPQIEGIGHLVASSVEGLSSDDVMIIDSQGNMLSKNQGDSSSARLSASQVEYQRTMEKDLSNQIQSMLENVVGRGKAVVRVNTDLDFQITEKTEEIYDPESPVIRSSQKQSDKTSGVSKTAPGTTASGPDKEKTEEIVNYEINKTVSRTVMPVGDIRKISIAVLVDGVYTKNEKGETIYQERAKKELESIEELVRKSSGFNAQRGDQVVVTSMPFNRTDMEQEISGPSWSEHIAPTMPIIKYIVILIGIALLFLLVIRPILMNVMANASRSSDAMQPQIPVAPGTAIDMNNMPQIALTQFTDKNMNDVDMARQLAGANAQKFAELLRNWLK